MDSGSGSPVIGFIKETGSPIEITDNNGNKRVLKTGDPVYLNDVIQNFTGTELIIELVNGQLINLAAQQQIIIGADLLNNLDPASSGKDKAQSQDESPVQERESSVPEPEASSDTSPPDEEDNTSRLTEQYIIERETSEINPEPDSSETSNTTDQIDSVNQNNDESLFSTVTINQKPEILDQSFNINENMPIDGSAIVGVVIASDQGSSLGLRHAIIDGNEDGHFAIDPDSGEISVVGDLNYEVTPSYALTIEVTDTGNLSETATITIDVNDLNETPEPVSDSASLQENESFVINVLANDTDEDFTDGPANFSLDNATVIDSNGIPVTGQGVAGIVNNQLSFAPGTDFDYLAAGETAAVTVRYLMSDDEGLSADSTVSIIITGTNDVPTITAATDVTGAVTE
ncbi:cadherin domain-containing protein, partial [Endozoicomonas elysicola]